MIDEMIPEVEVQPEPLPSAPEPEIPALIQPEPTPEALLDPEPVSEPVPAQPEESLPAGESAGAPVQVVSIDDLLDRLTQAELEETPSPDEEEPASEEEAGVSVDGIVSADNPLDLPLELAPVQVIGMDKLLTQTAAMQQLQTLIQQTLDHPVLTTSFADYTVTEGLLLLLLLFLFVKACADMLRRAFSWLL